MHTIVETPAFIRSAKSAGVTDEELDQNPSAGEEIRGTGGARKVRFAARGKGKSGGYRVITFYSGEDIPVFLLAVFAKGDKIDLTQQERNELRDVLGQLVKTYRRTS